MRMTRMFRGLAAVLALVVGLAIASWSQAATMLNVPHSQLGCHA